MTARAARTPRVQESHSFARERCTRAPARPRGRFLLVVFVSIPEAIPWPVVVLCVRLGLFVTAVLARWTARLLTVAAVVVSGLGVVMLV